jgi:uncharacterized membrane protein YphA (DoxX/SURF4 family)
MPDTPVRRGRLVLVARLLLGLVFLGSGLAGLLMNPPAPTSPPMKPGMVALFNGLVGSGYLLQLLKVTEAAVGALLLANRFVPLALTVLAPITVNIVAVHLLLAPEGLPIAAAVLALHAFLAWSYRDVFRPVLAARVP